MDMKEYQEKARSTAVYAQKDRVTYPALGLASEVGEVCGKLKKAMRDNEGWITSDTKKELKKELGDVLWYLSTLAGDLGLTLEEVAEANIIKLFSRKERGVLKGEGDNR